MFHIADPKDIKAGKYTDVYFTRTMEVLKAKKADKWVRAEFIAKRFPEDYNWGVLAGIEEVVYLIKDLPIKVRAMKEGTIFRAYEPVMEIEGMYTQFGLYETSILGLLCQASGVATKAARCKKAAEDRRVISFGARRIHPAIAPMVERNAFIGGCDGVAVVKDAEMIHEEPSGTMPHALILLIGDTVEATKAFDEVIDPKVKRVSLIDTFNDEKVEAIRVAEALGKKLFAIRLDTPSSRRGDFQKIIEEIRWELNLRGFGHVKIYVSGGLDEKRILSLNPVVDAYGVGTSITNARSIDLAMDIIEIEGKPLAKRGKMSGSKSVLRCSKCFQDRLVPYQPRKNSSSRGLNRCSCGGRYQEMLLPLIQNQRVLQDLPTPQAIRKYVLQQLPHFDL
ncbi:MAG: nicotinate phosphoribosyltransferase [Deltaproteobacteria bacterium]|nr:nicotinate phosphoribosyltransferase [Deltaproteobacteria bacterium]MBM4324857.1 nicotinate phosphoribosyltransferase [Deltaproteobacteria bacterium]MBM4346599.1 nicotinate phosphoribosyltransferase [Deltaproteobacteria bacterium]